MPISQFENTTTSNSNLARMSIYKLFIPEVSLSEVILNKEVKEDVMDLISIPDVWETVFNNWGLANVIRKTPKMAVNFYGPSGTGKTLLAIPGVNLLVPKAMVDIRKDKIGKDLEELEKIFIKRLHEKKLLLVDELEKIQM